MYGCRPFLATGGPTPEGCRPFLATGGLPLRAVDSFSLLAGPLREAVDLFLPSSFLWIFLSVSSVCSTVRSLLILSSHSKTSLCKPSVCRRSLRSFFTAMSTRFSKLVKDLVAEQDKKGVRLRVTKTYMYIGPYIYDIVLQLCCVDSTDRLSFLFGARILFSEIVFCMALCSCIYIYIYTRKE